MYLCARGIVACERSCICVLVESLLPVSGIFICVLFLYFLHLNTTYIYTCVLVIVKI